MTTELGIAANRVGVMVGRSEPLNRRVLCSPLMKNLSAHIRTNLHCISYQQCNLCPTPRTRNTHFEREREREGETVGLRLKLLDRCQPRYAPYIFAHELQWIAALASAAMLAVDLHRIEASCKDRLCRPMFELRRINASWANKDRLCRPIQRPLQDRACQHGKPQSLMKRRFWLVACTQAVDKG